jgi:hypothetical protein
MVVVEAVLQGPSGGPKRETASCKLHGLQIEGVARVT